MQSEKIHIGLDAGSTTIKVVVTNERNELIYKDYRRHYADITGNLKKIFNDIIERVGDCPAKVCITGSAGMGVAERYSIPFQQEVISSCEVIKEVYPDIKTFVDIGGEDSKMIFFRDGKSPDIRMNGSCAGGTGSFIDQMVTLLNVEMEEFSLMAERAKTIYPIASRCGVFSKTDVQNLLARNVSKDDISASVFHAVSMQVITSLARGYSIEPKLFLCGGPFTFIPSLRKAFVEEVGLEKVDVVVSEHSAVIPAWGAALLSRKQNDSKLVSQYIAHFNKKIDVSSIRYVPNSLKPLFVDKDEFTNWKRSKNRYKLPRIDVNELNSPNCFIGIDSGSTTTKIIATDTQGKIFFHYYTKNEGLSINAVEVGLQKLLKTTQDAGIEMNVLGSCVTGYGEDLIKKAFNLDAGIVETIAHYSGSYHFNKDVSFILDIGGQDMKAVYIDNGVIQRLEINEACSSGCGSFIETFAKSLNYSVPDFSEIALKSKRPCDLGTRCTVFMNSKVKQSQREGASVADISAGLGYSVVKNCLVKVLKIKDTKELGSHIMVQGGTFRNLSVIRALEHELGREVMVTDYPELMGAYGAALNAQRRYDDGETKPVKLISLSKPQKYTSRKSVCKGCENNCTVTRFNFENGNKYYSGNKCEKIFTNRGEETIKGVNQHSMKYSLLFESNNDKRGSGKNISNITDSSEAVVSEKEQGLTRDYKLTLGVPRVLGIYENWPFWKTLFNECGIRTVLSDRSTMELYEKGIGTVMADNICFPAKLTHGHIYNLSEKDIDRIFMPYVVYEKKDDEKANNSFNCPIVTGYSDVIKSSINTKEKFGIPLDSPTFTFADKKLMKKACWEYIEGLYSLTVHNTANNNEGGNRSITKRMIDSAFEKGILAQENYFERLNTDSHQILEKGVKEDRMVILLAGRPYHIDPLIQHKISDMVADFGVDVITEDIARDMDLDPEHVQNVTQWSYTNRIFKAAYWAANEAPKNVHYVQITSFGCGPDAFILDEVTDILKRAGKNITILKVDDINNLGSMRLRIRSLIESLKFHDGSTKLHKNGAVHTHPFMKEDKDRTILAPWFGDFYSPFIPIAGELAGYKIENLPPSDTDSVEYGLKYSNNEICYPATLVVGDLMKAVESGKYKRDEIALGITQTGGQCRATNYVSLIKKALIQAGYEDIPVVTVSGSSKLNYQPGFKPRFERFIYTIFCCMVYADCLSQFYYSTMPRETVKGGADKLKEKYINLGIEAVRNNKTALLFDLAEKASHEFMEINNLKEIPRLGIVGEIYVKYNDFGHKNVVRWLLEQGVEPVIPPITKFFLANIASNEARVRGYVRKRTIPKFAFNAIESLAYKLIRKMETNITHYPYYMPISNIWDDIENASHIINPNAQFGEGWRISAEFAEFVKYGVNNVVSLQPFGCIANHIISKGVEKRAREVHPSLNLLFLDFDSGMSEVNLFNRLHFMIDNARKELETKGRYVLQT